MCRRGFGNVLLCVGRSVVELPSDLLLIVGSFCGIASVAALTLNVASPVYAIFSSLQQIGFAFGLGIVLAITICAPVSGGHFNPGISLCFAIWGGFPWRKVPIYILSQIFGAFFAGLLLMGCYWPQIQELKAANIEQYGTAVYNGGAAGILCPFPPATQTNQGYLFLQEFFASSTVAIVIAACIDPANPFQTPVSLPYTIGLAYAVMVWGFGSQALALNTARDLGTRIVAAIFFGKEAFTSHNFCWIPILVNLPAYVFGFGFYQYVFRDSLQNIHAGHSKHAEGHAGLVRHLTKVGATGPQSLPTSELRGPQSGQDKSTVQHADRYV